MMIIPNRLAMWFTGMSAGTSCVDAAAPTLGSDHAGSEWTIPLHDDIGSLISVRWTARQGAHRPPPDSVLSKRFERRPHLSREEVRLFPRREMAAFVEPVV